MRAFNEVNGKASCNRWKHKLTSVGKEYLVQAKAACLCMKPHSLLREKEKKRKRKSAIRDRYEGTNKSWDYN